MRFFLALEIPEESKQEIQSLQHSLRTFIPNLRLTDPHKLHLTIAFIGEQDDSLKEDLTQVLIDSTQGITSFTITPAFIDGFPNLHNPTVLWVGVKGDIDKLMILRERVKDNLKDLEILVDERRFVPHIAIAKTSEAKITPHQESQIQDLILNSNFEPIKVSSIKLFESIPDHGLHSHNTLAEVRLDERM